MYSNVNMCQNVYFGYFDGSGDFLWIKEGLKAKNKLKIMAVPQGIHFFSSKPLPRLRSSSAYGMTGGWLSSCCYLFPSCKMSNTPQNTKKEKGGP